MSLDSSVVILRTIFSVNGYFGEPFRTGCGRCCSVGLVACAVEANDRSEAGG